MYHLQNDKPSNSWWIYLDHLAIYRIAKKEGSKNRILWNTCVHQLKHLFLGIISISNSFMPKHGIRLLYFYAVLSLGCFMLNTYCCHKMLTSKMKKNKENVYVTYFIIDSPNWTVPEKKQTRTVFSIWCMWHVPSVWCE